MAQDTLTTEAAAVPLLVMVCSGGRPVPHTHPSPPLS